MDDTAAQRTAALAALGLAPDATPAEVTSAYRRLARAVHPDRSAHDDAGARFALLAEAYRTARQVARQVEGAAAPHTAPHAAPHAAADRAPEPPGARAAAPRPATAATASTPPIVVGPVHVTPTGTSTSAHRPTRRPSSWPWWDVGEETW